MPWGTEVQPIDYLSCKDIKPARNKTWDRVLQLADCLASICLIGP